MRTLGLALTALVIGGSITPAAAQECPDSTGEGFRWKDPITKACHKGALNTKPKLRRGGTLRLTVVRNLIDFTDRTALAQQNIGVTFVAAGNTRGIGFITVDLALANAGLEDKIIRFPHLTGGFNPTVAIVRRGEVTGITQAPTEPRWGTDVAVTVKGRDIGNAGLAVSRHTLSGISNTDTEIKFTARADAATSMVSNNLIEMWDKGYTKGVVRYARVYVPGTLAPTTFYYAASFGSAPCVTVPNIGAPVLTGPANGSTATGFASPTDPVTSRTRFTWQHNDPERKYIFHLERYPLITSTTMTTTRSGTTALAPLNTMEKTVGPFSSDSQEGSVVELLPRQRTYKWKVRAVNCGLSTPWSTLFTHSVK